MKKINLKEKIIITGYVNWIEFLDGDYILANDVVVIDGNKKIRFHLNNIEIKYDTE